MLLVSGGFEPSRVSNDDVCILESVGEVVYHHVVEHACLLVLLTDVEVVFHALVFLTELVKRAFGDVQLGRCLRHGVDERVELQLRVRSRDVLEIEGQGGNERGEDDERTHDLRQRNACRLHGYQLKTFAEVTECHQGGEQHGKGCRGRPKGECRVVEKLGKNDEVQAFAHHVVNPLPQELHHEDEQADEGGSDEQEDKAFNDKYI